MSIGRLMLMASDGKASGPEEIGEAFGGGFYAGNIVEGGTEYYLIVAPKASGESTSQQVAVDAALTSPAATETLNNGPAATAAMVAAGDHPAAAFCDALTIDGFSDWYLPARDELELCYRNLKPSTAGNTDTSRPQSSITYPEGDDVSGDTDGVNRNSSPTGDAYTSGDPAQTSVTAFQTGGSEAFSDAEIYCSSTKFAPRDFWNQKFNNGNQDPEDKDDFYYVRAVRRVPV